MFPAQRSLPTRERGLKLSSSTVQDITSVVAPYAGAWIETGGLRFDSSTVVVAPYAGAWIETMKSVTIFPMPVRRSLRGSVD